MSKIFKGILHGLGLSVLTLAAALIRAPAVFIAALAYTAYCIAALIAKQFLDAGKAAVNLFKNRENEHGPGTCGYDSDSDSDSARLQS